jgi:hypothetical protein
VKFRILGTILILVVLGGLFVVLNDAPTQNAPTGNVQPVDSGDNALKGLKIN